MTEDRLGGYQPEPHTARGGDAIPGATVARLPVYLRAVVAERDAGASTISSDRLAELAGVNAAKVRKDLSFLGSYGIRGVGYDVARLMMEMSRQLGLSQDWSTTSQGPAAASRWLRSSMRTPTSGVPTSVRWRSTATMICPGWSPMAAS